MANKKITTKDIKIPLFRIMQSKKVGGVGIFAIRKIKKGTILGDFKKLDEDFFLPKNEFKKLDSITQKFIVDFYAQDKDGYYGPKDLNYLYTIIHMNHSCNPNVGFDKYGSFISIQSIDVNEELTLDYGTIISKPSYKLICKCGDKSCRKIITGNDWKNNKIKTDLGNYFGPLVRKLIKK